jgi:hypothetical protein
LEFLQSPQLAVSFGMGWYKIWIMSIEKRQGELV